MYTYQWSLEGLIQGHTEVYNPKSFSLDGRSFLFPVSFGIKGIRRHSGENLSSPSLRSVSLWFFIILTLD